MKRIISIFLALSLMAVLMASCSGSQSDGASSAENEKYTIMVYMVGSNLESESKAASRDIYEMMDSNLDLSKVNLLIYTGGSKMWYAGMPNDENSTYLMSENLEGEVQFERVNYTLFSENMGKASTLTSFLDYSCNNYPADHYGLICWDHGAGPLGGFGADELFDNDSLTTEEMTAALEASSFNSENKLDFVGFDACLMSSIEIADALKNYANYMIGSEETEPAFGWDYSFLSVFNETFDTVTVADRIIETYHSFYNELSAQLAAQGKSFNPDLTLSCLDLSKIDPVMTAMDKLFNRMTKSIDGGEYFNRAIERMDMKSYGNVGDRYEGQSYDMVDIVSLLSKCSVVFPSETDELGNALNDFVAVNKSNTTAGGVSIYYPFNGPVTYVLKGRDSYKSFTGSAAYRSYMDEYTEQWSSGWLVEDDIQNRSVGIQDDAIEKDELTVTLTDEQKKNYSRAYFNLFKKDDYRYTPIITGVTVEPDSDGNIKLDADQKIPFIKDSDLMVEFPLSEISCSDGVREYSSIKAQVYTTFYDMPFAGYDFINVTASAKDGDEKLTIKNIEYSDDKNYSSGKNTLDFEHWLTIGSTQSYYVPRKDSDGNMTPYSEWTEDQLFSFSCVNYDKSTELVFKPISELDYGNYCVQVIVEDVYGKKYVTDLMDYQKGIKSEEYTRSTSKGELTYSIYSDHAVLKSYKGNDKTLTIPEKVKNVPVTDIESKVFDKDSKVGTLVISNPDTEFGYASFKGANIDKVQLPDGLKNIGDEVFADSKITEINIPSSVERIATHAFSNCGMLRSMILPASIKEIKAGAFAYCWFDEFKFDGENPDYKIENGALYSKDGKIMYARTDNEDEIQIPDGVEEIAPWGCTSGVFYDADYNNIGESTLKNISFPETLKKIGNCAFRGCMLKKIKLPESVESVGHYSFANDNGMLYFNGDMPKVKSFEIGSKVNWIGQYIMGYTEVEKFKVSKDNRYYSTRKNRLTNKSGDSEIKVSLHDSEEEDKALYSAFDYMSSKLDLEKYEQDENDIQTYDGNDFSTDYNLKSDFNNSKKIGGDITLDGKKLKLPNKLSEIMKLGYDFEIPEGVEKTVKAGDSNSESLENKSGKKIDCYYENDTDKELSPNDCTVVNLSMTLNCAPDFEYCNTNNSSDIDGVIAALGEPSRFVIDYESENTSKITLSYSYEDKCIYHMTFRYDAESKKESLSYIDLSF